MSLILEDDNYVASKPHIFQNLLPHENNLHVCPAWLAASPMPMALVLRVILGDPQGLRQGSVVWEKGLSLGRQEG